MSKTLGVIEACPTIEPWLDSSTPVLPACRLGDTTLLQWVVRRVSEALLIDELVVVAPDERRYRPLEQLSVNAPIFFALQEDPLGRMAAAIERFSPVAVVRVGVENPFVDPTLIDRLIASAEGQPNCDYASYCLRDGRPAPLSRLGVFAEWFRADALRRANEEADHPSERQNTTTYLYSHPERFNVRLAPAPAALDREDLRLTVRSREDWDHIQEIVEALGGQPLDWQALAALLNHQPRMRERMAALNRTEAGV